MFSCNCFPQSLPDPIKPQPVAKTEPQPVAKSEPQPVAKSEQQPVAKSEPKAATPTPVPSGGKTVSEIEQELELDLENLNVDDNIDTAVSI